MYQDIFINGGSLEMHYCFVHMSDVALAVYTANKSIDSILKVLFNLLFF